jgi:hypothetical protein
MAGSPARSPHRIGRCSCRGRDRTPALRPQLHPCPRAVHGGRVLRRRDRCGRTRVIPGGHHGGDRARGRALPTRRKKRIRRVRSARKAVVCEARSRMPYLEDELIRPWENLGCGGSGVDFLGPPSTPKPDSNWDSHVLPVTRLNEPLAFPAGKLSEICVTVSPPSRRSSPRKTKHRRASLSTNQAVSLRHASLLNITPVMRCTCPILILNLQTLP